MAPRDTAIRLDLSAAAGAGGNVRGQSRLEQEVVELFDLLQARLLRYLLSLGLPVQDGEEIIQEVFLSLFLHLQHGKSRENLRGWLFRVAHNLALKRRDRNRRNAEVVREAGIVNTPSAIDPAPNPEEQFASSQTRERLLGVLQVLPEQDRTCLALRAEGLRYREIAEVLGISPSAVSLSLARSLGRLANAADR